MKSWSPLVGSKLSRLRMRHEIRTWRRGLRRAVCNYTDEDAQFPHASSIICWDLGESCWPPGSLHASRERPPTTTPGARVKIHNNCGVIGSNLVDSLTCNQPSHTWIIVV